MIFAGRSNAVVPVVVHIVSAKLLTFGVLYRIDSGPNSSTGFRFYNFALEEDIFVVLIFHSAFGKRFEFNCIRSSVTNQALLERNCIKTSNKLKINNKIYGINKQRKIECHLDKLFYKQISNYVFQSEEKVPH